MTGNDAADPPPPHNHRGGSRRGTLTIIVIFIIAAGFVGGLWLVSRRTPPAYRKSEVGTPARTLRVVSISLDYGRVALHAVMEQIRALEPGPDFLMVQQVRRREAHELAQALDMRHGGTVQMSYSLTDPITEDQPGNAILARWPLYQGRSMVKGRPFGIFTETVVDGKRFLLGCWQLSPSSTAASKEASDMLEAWRSAGEPPMIVAGLTSGLSAQPINIAGGGIGMQPPPKIAGLPTNLQRLPGGYREIWVTHHWSARQVAHPATRPAGVLMIADLIPR